MRPLPRTAISLYVALAVHALVLLAMVLRPPSQESSGIGQGLRVQGASLGAAERRVLAEAAGREAVTIESDRPPAPAPTSPPPRQLLAPSTEVGPSRRTTAPVAAASRPEVPATPDAASHPSAAAQNGGGGRDLYFARLRAHLAGFRRALRPGLPAARSRVLVAITADGWIEERVLLEPSGLPELDAEALDLFRRAAPLPAPPGGQALRLVVPVEILPP